MKDKLIWLFIAVLVAETVFLAVVNKNLKTELKRCRSILYNPSFAAEKSRMPIVPNFVVSNIQNGKTDSLFDMVQKDRLILCLFSTDCPNCDQMAEVWNDVYDRYMDSYTIIGISQHPVPEIEEYILRNDIRFPVVRTDKLSHYGFFSFPKTILSDNQGKIMVTVRGFSDKLKSNLKLK